MSEWAAKRFWKSAEVVQVNDGFTVQLDGRGIKTPARAPLVVPTLAVAELIAAEWQAQGEKIAPETMPATRAANAAIDKVRGQFDEVAGLVAAYGETDLLCYRARFPAELRARQDAAWDPLLNWSADRFGLRWVVTEGVMPQPQPPETLARLNAQVACFSPFELTAFHDLVALSGSLVIGLAVTGGQGTPEALWQLSRIDEDWQAEQWGDEERQHGLALGRWATLVDPAYDFEGRFARFREGFELDLATTASIRGSRAGELVARCMVEVGTSSYYTAIADACEEPVLQAIARRIAADELRHYKLFYDHLKRYLERDGLSRLRRIRVALSRINETEDDELAYAFHCANMEGRPYVRDEAYRAYHRSAFQYYRDPHIERALAMIFKAVGLKPHTTLFRTTKAGAMWMLARKQRRLSRLAAAA